MASASSQAETPFAAVTAPAPQVGPDASAPLDPLVAARLLGLPLSAYWEQPSEGEAVAGIGIAAERVATRLASALELLAPLSRRGNVLWSGAEARPLGPWFGGLAFDPEQAPGETWRGFPPSRWVLPELLIWRRDRRTWITAVGAYDPSEEVAKVQAALQARVDQVHAALTHAQAQVIPPAARTLTLRSERAAWDRLIARALRAIDGAELSKVVAARAIEVSAEAPFDVYAILDQLRQRSPTSTTFLLRGTSSVAFVGATPELLCRVRDGQVQTMALGGTRLGGAVTDGVWADDKERREHAAIVDGITHALRAHTETLHVPERPSLRTLGAISHPETRIDGRLKLGAGVGEVVRALHPTPAVGGTPRERALAFLRSEEGLDRGWYAGAVGFLGQGAAELRVALRSATVEDAQARVFVGAGIVEGSVAAAEWAETEAKAQPMLDALAGGPRGL